MTSSQPPEIRVALLGYGIGGAVFHAPLITATPGLRLDFVVTSNAERVERVRELYPAATVLASADELFVRSAEVDLVVVATPNRNHYDLAGGALRAGLPVVVDKPFTPTAAEGRALVEEAGHRGLLLTVFQNRRWDSDMRTLRRLVDAGELGRVRRFESRFERWVPTPKPGWREGGDPADAGGVLYDLGSHLIDQALLLFGTVRSVYAEINLRRAGTEVDDDSFVALTHANGTRSHLWMSKSAPQHGPRFRVLGERAGYTKYGLDPQEDGLRAGRPADDPGLGEEPEQCWGLLGVEGDQWPVPTERGRYLGFYEGVVAAMRGEGRTPVDPRDAVSGLAIIEAARRSAADGTVVRLG